LPFGLDHKVFAALWDLFDEGILGAVIDVQVAISEVHIKLVGSLQLKQNSWQSRPQGDCSRPSSRHVAAGREHDSKQCRTPSSLCREPSRCALAFRLGRLRRRHYQRGRQQDFVPGMRVPRSGLPRVFDSALAYISMQTPGGRCICTSSCLTRAKHSWRTCRISAAITDTCTATTAGSVHTATVRYQDKPPHTHRRGEGSA